MAKRRSERQWTAIIQRYQRGNLTQAGFCQHEKVSLSTFHYHLRRHRQLTAPEAPLESRDDGAPRLVELQLPLPAPPPQTPGPPAGDELVCIEWGEAVRIRCQSHQTGDILRQIHTLVSVSGRP